MLYEQWYSPDSIFASDSCLPACGGFWEGKYFHSKFPSEYSINILEMFAIIVCLKLWGNFFKGKRIQIFCDNESVCFCLNTGKSHNEILQNGLREVTFLAAQFSNFKFELFIFIYLFINKTPNMIPSVFQDS